ncbi:MAG TPA: cytochrome P450 [Sphingomonas sp.]|jgi:cytochrome P450|uniref:cytochrome P450 n=1 Tax=Sphingomonas sp. TaxID=28214 RepID=UPI002EDA1C89
MTQIASSARCDALPRMTATETATVLLAVGGPLLAKGVIVRRPWVVRLLQATGAEQASVRRLQDLRRRYGEGPVLLRLPMRALAVILSPGDLRRVLEATPTPFETDSREKHAALAHFEPRGSLISRGADRRERRRFNERVLETGCPLHGLTDRFRAVVAEECRPLSAEPTLPWGAFKAGWFRIVRRCVFGDAARDDTPLTDTLIRLRGDANWAFLKPRRRVLEAQFRSRVAAYLHAPEPGTLAALVRERATPRAAPVDQIGQWLFAFDAAGIATFRALAVLASDDRLMQRARQDSAPDFAYLRAVVLESVRLWPTTPAILRETDAETTWHGATMAKGTGLLIHVPFFHRDDERLPFAHRFAPDLWMDGTAAQWPLVPFSGGPGECPAKDLVLLLGSLALSILIRENWRLPKGRTLDAETLPPTFDQFSLTLLREGTIA